MTADIMRRYTMDGTESVMRDDSDDSQQFNLR